MILDTNFIIDVMEKEDSAIKKLSDLINNGVPLIITTPSLFELWSGVASCNKSIEEIKKIEEVILGQSIFEFDEKSAQEAGSIDGNLSKKGEKIEPVDCMIAGIAKTRNEKVLTKNIKHFEKTGARVETY